MALNHTTLDTNKRAASKLLSVRNLGLEFSQGLKEVQGFLAEFINGDGSADVHYAPMRTTGGVGASDAEAHNAYVQLDTLKQALETNASQTAVLDKLSQFLNYLGGN